MSQTQEKMSIEELVKMLENISNEIKKAKIEELIDIVDNLNNVINCLSNSMFKCHVEITFGFVDNIVVKNAVSITIDNENITIGELKKIIKDMIIKDAGKVVVNILTELRNVVDEIIDKTKTEDEQDP
ncbi:MAG: hypothetical protein QW215_00095 [Ignisphaera sp.]